MGTWVTAPEGWECWGSTAPVGLQPWCWCMGRGNRAGNEPRETCLKDLGPALWLWLGAPSPQELVHGKVTDVCLPCIGWWRDIKHQSWSLPHREQPWRRKEAALGANHSVPPAGMGFAGLGVLPPLLEPTLRGDGSGGCRVAPKGMCSSASPPRCWALSVSGPSPSLL